MSPDKDLWNLYTTKTREIIREEYSPYNLKILSEYLTTLDTLMRKYFYNEEWDNEVKQYEEIHTEYGNYRWINNV